MKKRALLITLAAGLAVLPLACAQISPVARSLESEPAGWHLVSSNQTELRSDDTQYFMSTDGLIVVQRPDGSIQTWRLSR